MSDRQPALACNLEALSGDERARRSTLASLVTARFREVQEVSDGYAGCLDPDPASVQDALDWLLLERRCCPFLRLELSFEPWFQSVSSQEPAVKRFQSPSCPSAWRIARAGHIELERRTR